MALQNILWIGRIQYQYVATVFGAIMLLAYGMLVGWSAPSLPQLLNPNSEIPMTSADGSWLATLPYIASPIGCLIAANLVDRIGRKKTILMVSPIHFISWIMVAYANDKYILFASRILCGVGDGIIFTVFPMYLGEIVDAKIRGLLCSSLSITQVFGFLLIAIIGSTYSIQHTALISAALPILHFVLFFFMPDSPYYLLMKNKPNEAAESLKKLRGDENVSEELDRISRSIKEVSNEKKGSVMDIFTIKSNRKAVYIILLLRFLQQFSGPLVITFYATTIFDEAGTIWPASTCTNIYFGVQIIASITCSILVDRVGRRPLLIVSLTGSCLTLATQGTYFYLKDGQSVSLEGYGWVPVTALLTYDVFFSLGMGTIPSAILGELFPPSVKAMALGLADVYLCIVVTLATKFFQITNDSMGMAVPFYVFAGCCGCALVYIIFWFPETKGKTLEEIQDYFKGNRKNKEAMPT